MTTIYPPKVAADEIAALPAVIALAPAIRLDELAPGDAQGPTAYKRVVAVALYDGTARSVGPIRKTMLVVRCYGTTRGDAWALWCAVEPAFRNRRPRLGTGRLGIWHSTIVEGSVRPDQDPATKQPLVYAVVNYPTTIEAIP